MAEAQREVERRASVWMLSWDPPRSRSLSQHDGPSASSARSSSRDRVVARLEPSPTVTMPVLLRQASYNVFHAPSWVAVDAALSDPCCPRPTAPPFAPGGPGRWWPRAGSTMSAYLPRGRGVLAIPNGATQLDDLMVVSLARNRLGAVRVDDGLGLVQLHRACPGARGRRRPPQARRSPRAAARGPGDRAGGGRARPRWSATGRGGEDAARVFLGRFSYSRYLGGARPGRTALEDFLLRTAPSILRVLRQRQLPSCCCGRLGFPRLHRGLRRPRVDAIERRWLVRSRDAHAWAMAWIDGAWVEVDTTPPEWMPIERGTDSMWQSAADLWEWGSFLISRSALERAPGPPGRQPRLALLPLITILAWRLWARRRISAQLAAAPAAAAAQRRRRLGVLPGRAPARRSRLHASGRTAARSLARRDGGRAPIRRRGDAAAAAAGAALSLSLRSGRSGRRRARAAARGGRSLAGRARVSASFAALDNRLIAASRRLAPERSRAGSNDAIRTGRRTRVYFDADPGVVGVEPPVERRGDFRVERAVGAGELEVTVPSRGRARRHATGILASARRRGIEPPRADGLLARRAHAFCQRPGRRVRSARTALAFVDAVGFCSTFYRFPRAWPACGRRVGRANPGWPRRSHHDDGVGFDVAAEGRLRHAERAPLTASSCGRPMLVALALFPVSSTPWCAAVSARATTGSSNEAGRMSQTAKRLMDVFVREHPQYTRELRANAFLLEPSRTREFERAMAELQQGLWVVKCEERYEPTFSYRWDLLESWLPDLVTEGRRLSRAAALDRSWPATSRAPYSPRSNVCGESSACRPRRSRAPWRASFALARSWRRRWLVGLAAGSWASDDARQSFSPAPLLLQ